MDTDELFNIILTPNKHGELLVRASGEEGQFDSHSVDCPFLFRHEGAYWMTYVGWDGVGYQTGLARSDDLLNWHKEGLIIPRGATGSVTQFNAAMTCIMRDNSLFGPCSLKKVDGRFVGTYHAYPDAGYEAGPGVIGLCYSDDLRTWRMGDAILEPDPSSWWEAGGLYKSWLMEYDGTYYLFYNAKNTVHWPWVERTGFATSPDLVGWRRWDGNPVLHLGPDKSFDEQFASDPCVFKHEDLWVMFYFGLSSDGHGRDSVAFSRDLVTWHKSNEVIIDIGPPGSVDSFHAHKPGIVTTDGKLYHFYCAVARTAENASDQFGQKEVRGISLATNFEVHSCRE